MSLEFMCDTVWYKYEDGWIHKKRSFDLYERLCPVLYELRYELENFSADQQKTVMEAILHGYGQGVVDGNQEKIQEFKKVFKLN